MIYLDNNATTKPHARVIAAIHGSLEETWGNPSSIHRLGGQARSVVEQSRVKVAQLVGAMPEQVIFTSGGTESCQLAIHSVIAGAGSARRLVTTKLEHIAVRGMAESLSAGGIPVTWIEAKNGVVDPTVLDGVLSRNPDTALVSIQWANNETGMVQDIRALGDLCRKHGVQFHVDATQWVGKELVSLRDLPIDLLSCSAHKFYGPKGVGALVAAAPSLLRPGFGGGSQEHGARPGTENVSGIVGMGEAAALASEWLALGAAVREGLSKVRDEFEGIVVADAPGAIVIGSHTHRLWNTTNIAFPRLGAEAIIVALSRRGVCASAGAACSSGSLAASPVILATGVPEELARGAVRFSFGREATSEQAREAAAIVVACVNKVAHSMPRLSVS